MIYKYITKKRFYEPLTFKKFLLYLLYVTDFANTNFRVDVKKSRVGEGQKQQR